MASRLFRIVLIASEPAHVGVRSGGDNRLIFEYQRGSQFPHGGHLAEAREIHPRLTQSLALFLRPPLAYGVVYRGTRAHSYVMLWLWHPNPDNIDSAMRPFFVVLDLRLSTGLNSTRLIRCVSTAGRPSCLPSEVCAPWVLHSPFEGVNVPLGQTQVSGWVLLRDDPSERRIQVGTGSNESRS